jgi:hypothetical protein
MPGKNYADHMSTQYRLVQSGKIASGSCSAGQGSSEPVAPRIYYYFLFYLFKNYGFPCGGRD